MIGTASSRPILIVGVTHRSGTNFVASLVDLHPGVRPAKPILEDHIPDGAGQVVRGIRTIVGGWEAEWIDRAMAEREVAAAVGAVLLGWVDGHAGQDERRLLSKTPGAYGLQDLLVLVPGADLVLLVRDGRDVTASGMRGFGWRFEEGRQRWLGGAREVLALVGGPLPLGSRIRVVRYEDFFDDVEGSLRELLTWLELDPEECDMAAARTMPVLGSSYAGGELSWEPIERPAGFDPRSRAGAWTATMQARFALRAGAQLRALGYPVPRFRLRTLLTAAIQEMMWVARRRLRQVARV